MAVAQSAFALLIPHVKMLAGPRAVDHDDLAIHPTNQQIITNWIKIKNYVGILLGSRSITIDQTTFSQKFRSEKFLVTLPPVTHGHPTGR